MKLYVPRIVTSLLMIGVLFWVTEVLAPFVPLGVADDFISNFSATEPPAPKKILFVGDVMLARSVEKLMNSNGVTYPFKRIAPFFTQTYIVGNFEAAVPKIHKPTPNFEFSFSVATSALSVLKSTGFTHMSLANNHSSDFGWAGLQHTAASLGTNGLTSFGGITISSLLTFPEYTVGISGVSMVYTPIDTALMQQEITMLADNSDFQILYIHWGNEYESTHSIVQENVAKEFIDMGYDAIIGHHPHVVQDIGWYKGAPIFYSLGNFVFDQYFSEAVMTGMAIETEFYDDTVVYSLYGVTSSDVKSQPRLYNNIENTAFLETIAQRSDSVVQQMIKAGSITQQIK